MKLYFDTMTETVVTSDYMRWQAFIDANAITESAIADYIRACMVENGGALIEIETAIV